MVAHPDGGAGTEVVGVDVVVVVEEPPVDVEVVVGDPVEDVELVVVPVVAMS
jgi:hypothetical protein